jgi:uncharacterized protein YqeY
MSNLLEKIETDFRTALKAHEAGRVSTLRLLLAAVKNAAIAARTSAKQSLDDADVEGVIRQEVKKLKDSLVDFSKAARQDLSDAAEAELKILQDYLPQGLNDEEVKAIVVRKIAELKAEGEKEFGKVMKAVQEEIKGRADGQSVAQAIKEKLSKL